MVLIVVIGVGYVGGAVVLACIDRRELAAAPCPRCRRSDPCLPRCPSDWTTTALIAALWPLVVVIYLYGRAVSR